MLARTACFLASCVHVGTADSEESHCGRSSLICLFNLFDFPVSNVGAHSKFVIVYFLVSNMGSIQGIFKEHVSNEVAPSQQLLCFEEAL